MIDLNKKVEMCMLGDFYGKVLTEKQRIVFSSYWESDCSLFEIAEELGITRQAVHDCLNKAEQSLVEMEQKCGFVKKYQETKADLQELLAVLDSKDRKQQIISEKIKNIITKL